MQKIKSSASIADLTEIFEILCEDLNLKIDDQKKEFAINKQVTPPKFLSFIGKYHQSILLINIDFGVSMLEIVYTPAKKENIEEKIEISFDEKSTSDHKDMKAEDKELPAFLK